MTAVIVQFKLSASEGAKSDTVAEICVARKRSVSPAEPIGENNECAVEENAVNPCKRPKTEAAI